MTADISTCSVNLGFHAFMAGPCFDTEAQAIGYRDRLAYAGTTWSSQDRPWPPKPPEGWVNPADEASRGADT